VAMRNKRQVLCYIYILFFIYTHTHTHTHIYIYIYIYIYVCVCVCVCVCLVYIYVLSFSSPYLLVFGDDRVRGTREQVMLQLELVRLSCGEGIIMGSLCLCFLYFI